SLFSNDGADPVELLGHPVVQVDDVVEQVVDLSGQARLLRRQPACKITSFEIRKNFQQQSRIDTFRRDFSHSRRLRSRTLVSRQRSFQNFLRKRHSSPLPPHQAQGFPIKWVLANTPDVLPSRPELTYRITEKAGFFPS